MNASWAARASARTKVTIWGARDSPNERQSLPRTALVLQSLAVISMMIRFAPQQPQALVLSWQTDSAGGALVLPFDDPYKGRQCPVLKSNAPTTGARASQSKKPSP